MSHITLVGVTEQHSSCNHSLHSQHCNQSSPRQGFKSKSITHLGGAICVKISSNHKISSRLNIQARPVEIEINVGENTFKWQVVKIFTT